MTTYARLTADKQSVAEVVDRDPAVIAALIAAKNPKADFYRPLIVDPQPSVKATQRPAPGPYVIEPARVRQTWVVSQMTDADIEQSARMAMRDQLLQMAAFFDSTAPKTLPACADEIQKLKMVCKWLLQQAIQRGGL